MQARVTDATLITSVVLTVLVNEKVISKRPMTPGPKTDQNTRSGVWTIDLSPTPKTSDPTKVRLVLEATNSAEMSNTDGESFDC